MVFNHIQSPDIEKLESADKEFQDLKRKNSKQEHKIFMRNETKLKLKKIAMENRTTLGGALDILIDHYESENESKNSLIQLLEQNTKELARIKEQNDTTNLLLKMLLKTEK